jgi:hypothetical protein
LALKIDTIELQTLRLGHNHDRRIREHIRVPVSISFRDSGVRRKQIFERNRIGVSRVRVDSPIAQHIA